MVANHGFRIRRLSDSHTQLSTIAPTKALALQLIEGPTLAEKIVQGPIPVEDALKIALQIAEGLEAAMRRG